jgi:diguanylate cyclase (GGDEF)-like protein/PAS domain S-box-containing protein
MVNSNGHAPNLENIESLVILSKVVAQIVGSIIIISTCGVIEYVNLCFEETSGYKREDILGKNINTLIIENANHGVYKKMLRAVESKGEWSGEVCSRKKNGRHFWELLTISMLLNSSGEVSHFIGTTRDITCKKQLEERLRKNEEKYRELSITDDLTRLYNQRYFYEQIKLEVSRASRYSQSLTVIMFDIDNFKNVNDIHGHSEGNKVLRCVGCVVKRVLRKVDSSYRYGGEEFMVILPMTTLDEGLVIAEKIRNDLKNETIITSLGKNIHITISVGVVECVSGEKLDVFLKRVDGLVYESKKNGKDRVSS